MIYRKHEIEEIDGIGRIRGNKLRKLGIKSSEDLLLHSEEYLRGLLGKIEYFPMARVPEFRSQAELMQIDGIDGSFAGALYKARRRSLVKLSYPDPSSVVRELEEAREKGLINRPVSVSQVARWQKRGLIIHYTGTLAGQVECDGKPIANATIWVGLETAQTNYEGKFWLPSVKFGSHTMIIRAEGFKRFELPVDIVPDSLPIYTFELTPGEDFGQQSDEAFGEPLLAFRPDDKLSFYDADLDELPEGTPLQFRHIYRNGTVRLIGVHRRRRGRIIEIPRVVLPLEMVGADIRKSDVFVWENGALTKSKIPLKEWRKRLVFSHLRKKLSGTSRMQTTVGRK